MTPTQLRAYVAVVRLGSVKQAAAELEVSESAVSLHVAQLRKEFGDKLFTKTAAGLAFTPGGLRLASRAAELLGLQDRTMLEVSAAKRGRRLLRVAASNLFAEFAAPGLIELFAKRAADLDVELSVRDPGTFESLLLTRAVDIAVGPRPLVVDDAITCRPVMNYRLVLVVGPDHPLAGVSASPGQLREQTWLLGPSAATDLGAVPALLRRLAVPDDRQQIFQSHAAALGEAKRGRGVAPALAFTVAPDVRDGQLDLVIGAARDGRGGLVLAGAHQPRSDVGRRRTVAVLVDTPGDSGDDARRGRQRGPLQAVGARDALELTGDDEQILERTGRQHPIAVGQRRGHARRPGSEPGRAGPGIQPDDPVRAAAQPGHHGGEFVGRVAVPAVRADHHNGPANDVRPLAGEQGAQVRGDAGAAEPVGHGHACLRDRLGRRACAAAPQ